LTAIQQGKRRSNSGLRASRMLTIHTSETKFCSVILETHDRDKDDASGVFQMTSGRACENGARSGAHRVRLVHRARPPPALVGRIGPARIPALACHEFLVIVTNGGASGFVLSQTHGRATKHKKNLRLPSPDSPANRPVDPISPKKRASSPRNSGGSPETISSAGALVNGYNLRPTTGGRQTTCVSNTAPGAAQSEFHSGRPAWSLWSTIRDHSMTPKEQGRLSRYKQKKKK